MATAISFKLTSDESGIFSVKTSIILNLPFSSGGGINIRKSNLPASPFIPDVDATVTASLAPIIDPTTGLTRTESALLSPSEKVIAQRSNQGIMGLV